MPVDNKELYLELLHQFVSGWLMDPMQFYGLYMRGWMFAPGGTRNLAPWPNRSQKNISKYLAVSFLRAEVVSYSTFYSWHKPSGWHIVGTK